MIVVEYSTILLFVYILGIVSAIVWISYLKDIHVYFKYLYIEIYVKYIFLIKN
jgi:hypothetical protein